MSAADHIPQTLTSRVRNQCPWKQHRKYLPDAVGSTITEHDTKCNHWRVKTWRIQGHWVWFSGGFVLGEFVIEAVAAFQLYSSVQNKLSSLLLGDLALFLLGYSWEFTERNPETFCTFVVNVVTTQKWENLTKPLPSCSVSFFLFFFSVFIRHVYIFPNLQMGLFSISFNSWHWEAEQ